VTPEAMKFQNCKLRNLEKVNNSYAMTE